MFGTKGIPKSRPSAKPLNPLYSISFEFIWQGPRSYPEGAEVGAIDVILDEHTQYEVSIPQIIIDAKSTFFIRFVKREAKAVGYEDKTFDFMKVSDQVVAGTIKLSARIITKMTNTKIKVLDKKTNQVSSPNKLTRVDEMIDLNFSGLKPGHHYKIWVSNSPLSSPRLQARLMEDGLYKVDQQRRASIEQKDPAPSFFKAVPVQSSTAPLPLKSIPEGSKTLSPPDEKGAHSLMKEVQSLVDRQFTSFVLSHEGELTLLSAYLSAVSDYNDMRKKV